uniref:Replication protein A subunit n=1 Tax=Helicotheca tamesis TaxID=374047 RepID=A0A7S2MWW4_9STRA|mmetsp:Transcript_4853/g.6643  ORF Transcript_4853/g.6643 Transcript_4853/m.6643 type:complete len:650 (+) Transcript_4853:102-2051(+)|eukprot:CAMPEP_0185736950 /NCGR_PEP_ID=MMETSP1171-20130828/29262_1 /TAXON_ID=374046 /ORGANISM="Helicotheca tamensis, Strain CCMP826" /LENGTH=649 /DNA_ID=CAMNT_0028407729 /DNA_START=45 /DNA_END=1994 /DNA_ORIENTATION=-
MSLTHGAVRTLAQTDGHNSLPTFMPTVQIIHVKKVETPGGAGSERFRAIISDGQHYVQGMLATQLNHLVHDKQIMENSIVKVDEFMNNTVQNRTVIILLKIEVINPDPKQRIGNPTDIAKEGDVGAGGGGTAPQAQPMYGQQQRNQGAGGGMYNQRLAGGGGADGGSGGGNPYQNRFSNNTSSAPIVRSSASSTSSANITPISALNMYMNRWVIRARVTSKSDIRTWSNARGEGSLFSVELLDSSGQDIRATFFKEAVDKFYHMLEQDRVYTFSGGRLKVANAQYNTCKSQFEVTFDQNAEIHLDNDMGDIQHQLFDFVPIAQLENIDPGKYVDVVGVVKSVGQTSSIMSKKSGQELLKADLVVADDSGAEVNLTVWGERANEAQRAYVNCPVVAFRRARVSDFGGRSLSLNQSSPSMVNPRITETQRLQSWWSTTGNKAAGATRSLSSGGGGAGRMDSFNDRKTISSIKDENMGHTDPSKPDWLSFKGTFNFIKKDREGGAWYPACSNSGDPCKNMYKVTQTTDGNWFCDKCQGTSPSCVRRFIFSATVTDDTSTTWVSVFNEQAEVLFGGVTADDVYKQTYADPENQNQDVYDSYFTKANFTDWILKCKVKQDTRDGETRVKTSVYSLHPVDYAKESRDLLKAINAF